MTIDQRLQKAEEMRRTGANCSQCVLGAFPDITGLDEATARRVAQGLGGGVGASGDLCGVVSAMAMLQGFRTTEKPKTYSAVRALKDEFTGACGSCLCRELKGKPGALSCDELIRRGITIFHNSLCKEA